MKLFRPTNLVGSILGIAITSIGLLVFWGWIFKLPHVLQIQPDFAPMQINTALGFLFCGTALILIGQEKFYPAAFLGLLIFLLGGLTQFQYLTGYDIGIDNLFLEHYLQVQTEFQGRMAFNTAFCFSLIGLGLFFDLRKNDKENKFLLIGLSGALVTFFSVLVLAGYLFSLETHYGLGHLKGMALHTAFGLLSAGIALIFFSREHHKVEGVIQFLFLTVLAASVLVIWILAGIRKQVEAELQNQIKTTLNITEGALKIWADEIKRTAMDWSELPGLKQPVKQLLLHQEKELLLPSPSIKELDNILEKKLKRHNFLGYIVISPSYINLASLLKLNIGDLNILVNEKDYLRRAFEGEVLLTIPLETEIPLPGLSSKLGSNAPTMFALAPVYDEKENVMAVVAFRLNPFLNFAPVLELGRLGETGETYAFDETGRMISPSRYESDLRKLGMLENSQSSILTIKLKDPGFELGVKNLPVTFEALPLTQMVSRVIDSRSSVFIDKYRDYRGYSVVGAGTWVMELGFGLVTEVDLKEAWGSYEHTYNLVVVGLLIIIALFFILSLRLYYRRNQLIIKEEKANRLLKAVEHSPNPIIIADVKGQIEYVNPKLCEMTEMGRDDILGQNPRIFSSGTHKPAFYKEMWKTLLHGEIWSGEILNRRKSGELFWISSCIAPMQNEKNKISHFVAVWEDITNRKKIVERMTEQRSRLVNTVKVRTKELEDSNLQLMQAEKLSAVGKLAAAMAHEFNNPIFGIRNVLERVAEQVRLPKAHRRSVDLAIKECNRISKLIGSLMEFNRPTSDERIYMDVHESVEEILLLLEKRLLNRNIKLVKKYGEYVPKAWIVPDQFKQVILNLLSNAEEAIGDSEEGRVEIATEYISPYIHMRISDNGSGIAIENLDKIFEPFFTTKSSVKGTGLGLSVSYGIINSHGGTIRVETDSQGTSFAIRLPANRNERIMV